MNALLIYPEFPDTFWSLKHTLKFVRKRSALPPLGLATVAAMLPPDWHLRFVDLNVRRLKEDDLAWAECAFVGAMAVQTSSAERVIARCKAAGVRVVAGGPLFTSEPDRFADVDHLVLNEAELTLPPFLADLAQGRAKHIYTTPEFPDVAHSPIPRWDVLDLRHYAEMSIQYSRGCPFNCEFCNVTALFGHRPRTKTPDQVIAELNGFYDLGWRGGVFVVDDNFIGHKGRVKGELLPALIEWRSAHPGLTFHTEASIDLADDPELMRLMVDAGFNIVFIGIETPDEESLVECSKRQNTGRDLVADVKRIQAAGLQVQGGFIVGFDHDRPSIFQRQIDFIQKSGIVTAMVGLLQAPFGTRLYERLHREGRVRGPLSGDNADGTTNIIPRMNGEDLRRGYQRIIDHLYAPKHYYERIKTFLREYRLPAIRPRLRWANVLAFVRSIFYLGIVGRERMHYWGLLLWTRFRRPELMSVAITLAVYGYHFRRVCELQRILTGTPIASVAPQGRRCAMNGMLWFVQAVLALLFLVTGIMKVRGTKDQLVLGLKWVEDFEPGMLHFIGAVEILGAIGLVLPGLVGLPGWLVPAVAFGLAVVMIGAVFTHLRRNEHPGALVTAVVLALTIFVACGRIAVPLPR